MAACSVGGWAGHSAAAPSGLNLPPAANLLTENARLHREREMVVTENQRLREEIDALSDALRRAVGPAPSPAASRGPSFAPAAEPAKPPAVEPPPEAMPEAPPSARRLAAIETLQAALQGLSADDERDLPPPTLGVVAPEQLRHAPAMPRPPTDIARLEAEIRTLLAALRHADRELRLARQAIADLTERGGGAGAPAAALLPERLRRSRSLDREELAKELVQTKLRAAQLEFERDEQVMAVRKLQVVNKLQRAVAMGNGGSNGGSNGNTIDSGNNGRVRTSKAAKRADRRRKQQAIQNEVSEPLPEGGERSPGGRIILDL